MVKLYDNLNGAELGVISEEQLRFLQNDLEEESVEDRDYYINQSTVDWFESQNADPALVALLRQALGDREDMEIRWVQA